MDNAVTVTKERYSNILSSETKKNPNDPAEIGAKNYFIQDGFHARSSRITMD